MVLLQPKGASMADPATLFILLIEHDDDVRDSSVKTLEEAGAWQVVQVVDIAEAVDQLKVMSPSVALLDPLVSDIGDAALLARLQALAYEAGCAVVLSTRSATDDVALLERIPQPSIA
jgi:DNA-binding NtrC family response regulator